MSLLTCLQCIIPVIEGLFPKGNNKMIMDLLYTLAEWHSYAKLRLHTESTLQDFEEATKRLCDLLRKFKKTVCKRYITKELPREINARGRRTARLAAQGKEVPKGRTVGARNVQFNMNTYKMHALPDYPLYVRALGTTDNFTTQMVYFFLTLSTLIIMIIYLVHYRVNLSIKGQKDFTFALTKGNLQYKLQSTSDVNDVSKESEIVSKGYVWLKIPSRVHESVVK